MTSESFKKEPGTGNDRPRSSTIAHRAMFKLGAKIVFLLCLLVKNVSADYSADRCNS